MIRRGLIQRREYRSMGQIPIIRSPKQPRLNISHPDSKESTMEMAYQFSNGAFNCTNEERYE
jgi:hypothetical protein